jgi:hypothetical protein
MKQNSIQTILVVLGTAILVIMTGCASRNSIVYPAKVVHEAAFSKPLIVSSHYVVTDQEDPVQLIKKGVSMSQQHRHGYAAEFFQMASTVPAPDNELRMKALFAEANEYLHQGDISAFTQTMQKIDRSLSRFQRADLSEQEATLMALHAITQDKNYRSGIHPSGIRELFQQEKEN